ncbi:hypothetical protein SDC9_169043 [bioreactor metagenome]|uniref:Uncharacterized protein n=1 Tax=bioreactor metagenome TaxID=1076179 RepID=A0A645GCS7_9ZZZZ
MRHILGDERSVGGHRYMDALFMGVFGHRPEILVHQRFPARKSQGSDVVLIQFVDHVQAFFQRQFVGKGAVRVLVAVYAV